MKLDLTAFAAVSLSLGAAPMPLARAADFFTPVAKPVIAIAAADSTTCFGTDAEVACFGENIANTNGVRSGFQHIRQIAMSGNFVCVLDDRGVSCSEPRLHETTKFTLAPPALDHPLQIAAGNYHACALDANGVVCWGDDGIYQTHVPVLSHPREVKAAGDTSCAIDDTGVKCWGSNIFNLQMVPSSLQHPRHLSMISHYACVVDDVGLHCWGQDEKAKFLEKRWENVSPIENFFLSDHECAVVLGTLKCSGTNVYGESKVPQPALHATQVAAGTSHTCAIVDGGVQCWGRNESGQSKLASALHHPTHIAASFFQTCALENKKLLCWGKYSDWSAHLSIEVSEQDQIAISYGSGCVLHQEKIYCADADDRLSMRTLETFHHPKQIVGLERGFCALDDDGVHCWGDFSPSLDDFVRREGKNALAIATSTERLCILKENSVECDEPRLDQYGQTTSFKNQLHEAKQVFVRKESTCVLDEEGFRCVALPYASEQTAPPLLLAPTQIAVTDDFGCAIDSGEVECWGDRAGTAVEVPKGIHHPRELALGSGHACVLDDETVKCWGINLFGESSFPAIYESN